MVSTRHYAIKAFDEVLQCGSKPNAGNFSQEESMSLAGKNVLITGSSRGIGRGIAPSWHKAERG